MYKQIALTEPAHLSQESTNNVLQNVTRYVIPEACEKIVYTIVSAKRDTLRDDSSICKTRVTYVTVMDGPYSPFSFTLLPPRRNYFFPKKSKNKDYHTSVSRMDTKDLLSSTLTEESHTEKGETKTCLLYGSR